MSCNFSKGIGTTPPLDPLPVFVEELEFFLAVIEEEELEEEEDVLT